MSEKISDLDLVVSPTDASEFEVNESGSSKRMTRAQVVANMLPKAGGEITGNITMAGAQTVDGRDLSVDGTKLDGIGAGADMVDPMTTSGDIIYENSGPTRLGIGSNTQVLTVVGGTVAWSAATGGLNDLVDDTTPQLGGQLDVNGNAIGNGTEELITFVETPSAVNEIEITSAATGTGPTISVSGDDTNTDLNITAKGTGAVNVAGRDIAVDGTKLDGIGALANVTSVFSRTGVVTAATSDYDADQVDIPVISTPTFTSVEDALNVNHSSGWVSGGAITVGTDTTKIDVAVGTGFIRATNSNIVSILSFDWPAADELILTDVNLNWIYAEYNSGTPQIIATTTERTDFQTNVLLGTVFRDGTTLHITEEQKRTVGDHAGQMINRLHDTAPFARTSGGVTTETGTRNLAVSAGSWWEGLEDFTTAAIDTSVAGTFSYFYDDNAGGFTEVASSTQIDNLQYDDGSGTLATLSNSRYGVHWIYIGVDGDLYVVYGTTNGTLGVAEDAVAPSNVPAFFDKHVRLIAKVIILKSASTFADLTTAFETSLTGSTGIANVVDDVTPQLGGDLDVNGNQIVSISGTNIDLHSDNDVVITLGDAAGVDDFLIQDSGDVTVFGVTSDGNVTVSGTIDGRDIAADGAVLDTALQNISEDTTPQLGGNLDVAGNQIVSVSGTDIDLHSDNNVIITLGDAAGTDSFQIQDSGDVTVFLVDSDGNVTLTGTLDGRDIAADGAVLDTALQNLVEDTTPQLGGMLDINGNSLGDGTLQILSFVETASAVNEITITNAATGNGPTVSATGDNTDIDLNLNSKGTGTVIANAAITAGGATAQILDVNSNQLFIFTATGSAINEFTIANAAAAGAPTISATGGDTNIDIDVTPKGTGKFNVTTGDVQLAVGANYNIGAPGAASSLTKLIVTKTGLTDAAVTAMITVTIPNVAHSAVVEMLWNNRVSDDESARVGKICLVINRVLNANTVSTFTTIDEVIATAGTETLTQVVDASGLTGASTASQTFNIQVTLNTSASTTANSTVYAQLLNGNATGITMAVS